MAVDEILAVAEALRRASIAVEEQAERLVEIAESLRADDGAPAWVDLRDTLPVNAAPDEPWLKARGINDWWVRADEQIDGITIHHVASNGTPQSTALYITRPVAQGGKGLPRMQYHFWIEPSGEIFYTLDLRYGCWHDCCGHQNTHVSVVLNGALHKNKPTPAALAAAARLTAWLMESFGIGLYDVTGHNEWAMRCLQTTKAVTQCPGWTAMNWREDFYTALNGALAQTMGRSYAVAAAVYVMGEQLRELDDLGRRE